eukprot:CAMPEP_0178613572 /NCGR_PEP_ID=MMETSP0698-20121128/1715_1 /TAXON_ID=265572 /ORGANISM="Extubocellulus spinifer, Strain CCMP396" /LENGTH=39 /DNA_ID= /DNA_START= /DNA_END= /DNA_ORIENTATION=
MASGRSADCRRRDAVTSDEPIVRVGSPAGSERGAGSGNV